MSSMFTKNTEEQYTDQTYNPSLPPVHNDRLDFLVRFYSRKFHFFTIPITIILAIVHLKYGIEYLGQCPIQPMINIYMIVHAGVAILIMLFALMGVLNVHCIYPQFSYKTCSRVLLIFGAMCTCILVLFGFAWLIAGSVWIFGAKTNGVQGSDPTNTATYCQSDLYRAAFVLLIVNYVLHILIFMIIIGRCIYRKSQNRSQPTLVKNSANNKF